MLTDFSAVVKKGNFKFLWISQTLSQLTLQVMNFLLLVRIYEETGSTIATSFIWIAFALPAILLGPIGSAWVDMVDRRKVLMVSNILQALTILGFALVFEKYLFLSFGVVLIYSIFNQFYVPAESASLPQLVSQERFPQANGIFLLTQQFAVVVGFGAAGILKGLLGYRVIFLSSAVLLFLAFVSVSFLPQMKNGKKENVTVGLYEFFQEIIKGYKFIKNRKDILLPFLLLIGLQVSLVIITVSLPVISVELLKRPASASGIFVVVPALVGAIASTVVTSRKLSLGVRKIKVMGNALLFLGLAVWAVSLLTIFPPLAREIISFVIFFAAGAGFVSALIPAQTYLQEVTPKDFRGRLFGNIWFLSNIATVIPVIFTATISEVFGIKPVLILLGAWTIGAKILLTRLTKGIVK